MNTKTRTFNEANQPNKELNLEVTIEIKTEELLIEEKTKGLTPSLHCLL